MHIRLFSRACREPTRSPRHDHTKQSIVEFFSNEILRWEQSFRMIRSRDHCDTKRELEVRKSRKKKNFCTTQSMLLRRIKLKRTERKKIHPTLKAN